jgi:hypothetical protein
MRIALLCAVVAAAALAAVGAAPAKEVTELQVCGPDACATVTDRDWLSRFENSVGSDDVIIGAAAPAEYYVVRGTIDAGDSQQFRWENYYVPGGRALRGENELGRASWRRAPAAQRALLNELAAGVRPYPVPVVTKASVGHKEAAEPASYLNLYRLKRSPRALPKRPGWQRIRLTSEVPSPWTDGKNVLRYLPKERLLERDGQYVRLAKRLARAVQRAAALQIPG